MNEIIRDLAGLLIPVDEGGVARKGSLPVPNLQRDYLDLLEICNGGYTPDYFFHFFGHSNSVGHDLERWNEESLWKGHFGLGSTDFVFAEDIFGTQFYFDVRGNRRVVKMFQPDGGRRTLCANTFEDFVKRDIFGNEPTVTEIKQVAETFWKETNEVFRRFVHISPEIPVCLGGDDQDLENLRLVDSAANLKILGQIHKQIKGLAQGTRIRDVIVDVDLCEVKLVVEE